MGMVISTL